MLKDITLGQYYPTGSLIHQLDARVKMFAVLSYMILLFLQDNVMGYLIHVILLGGIVLLSKIPMRKILQGLKAVWFLLLFSVIFTVLFTDGEDMLLHYGILKISWQGIFIALRICVRIFLLIFMSTMLTLTTSPTDLADALEKVFRPLSKIGVPVHEIAMMMTIALRFIPILMEETDKIMKAQQARGADFESGNVFQRAKKLVPIFIPLIVSSVKRSMDLAMAMEARCYSGGEGRTKMKPLIYQKRDKIAYALICVYIVLMVIWRLST